jgi:glucose-1-phosphate thymidylyltransferase long form
MKAIIIAGGFGTRLRPLTYNTPKSMVPVANIPFVLHQIELLKKYGINEIILNLHYLSDNIKQVLADEAGHGIKVYYSIEEKPLGTAGAVKNAEEYFDNDPMIVFNGDILTDINLSELLDFHRKKNAKATLTLTRVEDPTTYGLVITGKDGRVERFLEKPSWERVTTNTINAGIYVLDPQVFANVPKGVEYSFERQLFPGLLESGEPVFGYASDAYWIDIGNPSKYLEAHRAILEQEVEVLIRGEKLSDRVWVESGTKIDKESRIFGPAIIGADCVIEAEAKIDAFTVLGSEVKVGKKSVIANSVIWDSTVIGNEASINDCVIGFGCKIEDNVMIKGGVVLADGTKVAKGSKLGIKL